MLKGILSISGKPGLYKMVTQGKNSIIVESLFDGKRFPSHSFAKVISLDDIAIFTLQEEKPLKEVFRSIMEKEGAGNPAPNTKELTTDQLKSYFAEILPNYDSDRVYVSDMKKVLTWFNILLEKDLLKDEPEADESAVDDGEEAAGETPENGEKA